MLYFSKLKILIIAVLTAIFVFLTLSNFIKFNNPFFEKKINLGLDLQGGSYLLLEIDNKPVITQKLQNKTSSLRKFFKDNGIKATNFKIADNEKITFVVDQTSLEKVLSIFEDKESQINPYYPKFKTHEFDFEVNKVWESHVISLQFSRYGLVELKKRL